MPVSLIDMGRVGLGHELAIGGVLGGAPALGLGQHGGGGRSARGRRGVGGGRTGGRPGGVATFVIHTCSLCILLSVL